MNLFNDLFGELLHLAQETRFLIEEEKGMDKFKIALEEFIQEVQGLLVQPAVSLFPRNDDKMAQLIEVLKEIFQDMMDFFAENIELISKNQRQIQAYLHYALENF